MSMEEDKTIEDDPRPIHTCITMGDLLCLKARRDRAMVFPNFPKLYGISPQIYEVMTIKAGRGLEPIDEKTIVNKQKNALGFLDGLYKKKYR